MRILPTGLLDNSICGNKNVHSPVLYGGDATSSDGRVVCLSFYYLHDAISSLVFRFVLLCICAVNNFPMPCDGLFKDYHIIY